MAQIRKHLRNSIIIFFVVEVILFFYYVKPSQPQRRQVIKHMTGDTLDHSGQYRIIRFFRSSGIDENYLFYDITIATQCSVNHLHHLVELISRWSGPISCAVFAPKQDASYADDAIKLLKKCFPKIQRHVSFHLVYPSSYMGNMEKTGSWIHLTCNELLLRLENYGYQNYDVAGISFPHNVLRNAARTGVLTQYVLLVDIDVMPNVGLREQFLVFASQKSLFHSDALDQTAFVLPAFEVRKGFNFPKDKKELLNGIEMKTIRPFHNETCWWCHKAEKIELWSKVPQSSNLEIAFETEWDKSWEPFYIARRDVPMFDGRFKQYGFDRIQQICEMHVAGYKFVILNNAFLTHHGWKFAGKFYAKKDVDNAQNWILFNYHFKDELMIKYNTSRTCSPVERSSFKAKSRGDQAEGRGVVKSMFHGEKVIPRGAKLS